MERNINFSGLGFELGQTKRGLMTSPVFARNYFPMLKNEKLRLFDQGDIFQDDSTLRIKFFSEKDLKKMQWGNFHQAYLKTITLLNENNPLVNWGGDHSIAISTISAFKYCYNDGYVIWIDAHADLNLPNRSLSGNLHGMPMSILLNLESIANYHFKWITQYIDPKKLIYIGLRDLDPFERNTITTLGIKTIPFEEIKEKGIEAVANEVVEFVKHFPVHISFDVDSVDPVFAPSTGVQVENGFSPNDLNILGNSFSQNLNIKSVDVVEVNPLIGGVVEIDQTFRIAFNFLKSIFKHNNEGDINESMGKRNQTKRFTEMEWSL